MHGYLFAISDVSVLGWGGIGWGVELGGEALSGLRSEFRCFAGWPPLRLRKAQDNEHLEFTDYYESIYLIGNKQCRYSVVSSLVIPVEPCILFEVNGLIYEKWICRFLD